LFSLSSNMTFYRALADGTVLCHRFYTRLRPGAGGEPFFPTTVLSSAGSFRYLLLPPAFCFLPLLPLPPRSSPRTAAVRRCAPRSTHMPHSPRRLLRGAPPLRNHRCALLRTPGVDVGTLRTCFPLPSLPSLCGFLLTCRWIFQLCRPLSCHPRVERDRAGSGYGGFLTDGWTCVVAGQRSTYS